MKNQVQQGDIPESLHVDTNNFPYARDYTSPGLDLMLLQADIEAAVTTVRIRFQPGMQLPTHKHTGIVHAYTLAGSWRYLEYPDSPPNTAGSYLYEPPGSTHTLKVDDDNTGVTDVVFIVYGAMLILDDGGNVVAVFDAQSQTEHWQATLLAQGQAVPSFIRGGTAGYMRSTPPASLVVNGS
ncbi:2,4'-dihydroxyacetophenone dioxygenase family protein [Massilia sp. METH4]|uniref:2,4'-dihydroxyacetophenone dioxygenase family protein n=1 Tax=Massilia sp. METH4 TaxID=3123041 RepID=UPI0030D110C6